jgi:hypothetical protein
MANAIYTNMPFVLEARMSDSDSFPNPTLEWSWSTITQPAFSNLYFLSSTSITPTILVDTAGSYVVELSVFDGEAITTATFSFQAGQSYAASEFLSGSCASVGSGVSTVVSAVYSSATSVISQNDANAKAAASAANALSAVLNCCPASFQLNIPPTAPSGSTFSVYVMPVGTLPQTNFGTSFFNSNASGIHPIFTVTVPSVETASYIELVNSIPFSILSANQYTNFIIVGVGLSEFNVTVAPISSNGNASGIVVTQGQNLDYGVFVPQPAVSRFSATIGF